MRSARSRRFLPLLLALALSLVPVSLSATSLVIPPFEAEGCNGEESSAEMRLERTDARRQVRRERTCLGSSVAERRTALLPVPPPPIRVEAGECHGRRLLIGQGRLLI
jgi:hypothetical protein